MEERRKAYLASIICGDIFQTKMGKNIRLILCESCYDKSVICTSQIPVETRRDDMLDVFAWKRRYDAAPISLADSADQDSMEAVC